MRRCGLLQPAGYQGERRELARARKAAFAEPVTRPDQVWQLDFFDYETTMGGTWRLAGVTDYFSKYEHGWHISPTSTAADAIAAVKIAIAGAERLGGAPLAGLLPAHDDGSPVRIRLVTDNGPAFKSAAFARFIASRPELLHIRTRHRSPRARLRLAQVRAPLPPRPRDRHPRRPAPRGRGLPARLQSRPARGPRHAPAGRDHRRPVTAPRPQHSEEGICARSLTRDSRSRRQSTAAAGGSSRTAGCQKPPPGRGSCGRSSGIGPGHLASPYPPYPGFSNDTVSSPSA